MPRIFKFYVIKPERLEGGQRRDVVSQWGALWADIESKARDVFDAFDDIDQLVASPVLRGRTGPFTTSDLRELVTVLVGLPSAVVGGFANDETLERTYWALRDTAEEALSRNATMIIEVEG